MRRAFALLLLLVAVPAAAGPHYHHGSHAPFHAHVWHGSPRAYIFPAGRCCWCWRGGVWVWLPVLQVQVGEGVWVEGQVYRIGSGPIYGPAGISIGMELWR